MSTRRWPRRLAWTAIALLATVGLGPFLLPLPSLDTSPPSRLGNDADRFVQVAGVDVRYRTWGTGEPALLLFHGFGSHADSWAPVAERLGRLGLTVAFDRVGFGLTERPPERDRDDPYAADVQVRIALELLNRLEVEQVVLIGHSAGGAVALDFAVEHPDRVTGIVLEAPAFGAGAADWVRLLAATPPGQRLTRFVIRRAADRVPSILASAYHDPGRLTPEMTSFYQRPLEADSWDQGLARHLAAAPPSASPDQLEGLDRPVLFVTGDDDTWVATEDVIRLSSRVAGSEMAVISECGHAVHEECPDAFLEAVEAWMAGAAGLSD